MFIELVKEGKIGEKSDSRRVILFGKSPALNTNSIQGPARKWNKRTENQVLYFRNGRLRRVAHLN